MKMDWLVIGISGPTCSGKTTLAEKLHKNLTDSILIEQDKYFLPLNDSRHTRIPELNHTNFEIISSLDMEKLYSDILEIINEKSEENNLTSHCTMRILIIEGFSFFIYKPIADLCNIKYFLTLTREECWNRRQFRSYNPPDVPGYFDKIVWPEYMKYKEAIDNNQDLIKGIKFLDGTLSQEEVYEMVSTDIHLHL